VIVDLAIETAPLTAEHARLARDAYRAFGKGHHPARPDYGDWLA